MPPTVSILFVTSMVRVLLLPVAINFRFSHTRRVFFSFPSSAAHTEEEISWYKLVSCLSSSHGKSSQVYDAVTSFATLYMRCMFEMIVVQTQEFDSHVRQCVHKLVMRKMFHHLGCCTLCVERRR